MHKDTLNNWRVRAEWEQGPAKNRQKDKDARWTKKHGRSFFGYKNHVNVDRTHKLIRRYAVTDAAVHDSRKLNGLLHRGNTSKDVFGDSAYRSAATEATLKARGFRSRIHVRAARGHPLSKAKAAANRAKSRIRARIEHVFGAQETAPGGRIVRTIGIVRARLKIRLAEPRLQCSPARNARTQEVPRFVQPGGPTGHRLRAGESARRGRKPSDRRKRAPAIQRGAPVRSRRSTKSHANQHQPPIASRKPSLFEVPISVLVRRADAAAKSGAAHCCPAIN